jgi:hypothetical protein
MSDWILFEDQCALYLWRWGKIDRAPGFFVAGGFLSLGGRFLVT